MTSRVVVRVIADGMLVNPRAQVTIVVPDDVLDERLDSIFEGAEDQWIHDDDRERTIQAYRQESDDVIREVTYRGRRIVNEFVSIR